MYKNGEHDEYVSEYKNNQDHYKKYQAPKN